MKKTNLLQDFSFSMTRITFGVKVFLAYYKVKIGLTNFWMIKKEIQLNLKKVNVELEIYQDYILDEKKIWNANKLGNHLNWKEKKKEKKSI